MRFLIVSGTSFCIIGVLFYLYVKRTVSYHSTLVLLDYFVAEVFGKPLIPKKIIIFASLIQEIEKV